MDIKLSTQNKRYICTECQNESELKESDDIGDVVECPFCGIEYEIVSKDNDNNFTLTLLEEEK